MTPYWRKRDIIHDPGTPTWEVQDVIDGFAQVLVHFDHHDIYSNGERRDMPSNDKGYLYEFEVGPGVDEAEATDMIQSHLDDNSTVADLIELLETL